MESGQGIACKHPCKHRLCTSMSLLLFHTDPPDKVLQPMHQAGTFEERDVTEWAKERLRGLLEGLEYCSGSALVTLKELKSTSGEAHVWLVRGKRR